MEKPTKDLYIDADSWLYKCGFKQDERSWKCTHPPTGRVMFCDKKKEPNQRNKEWVARKPDKRSLDDFVWEEVLLHTGSLESAQKMFMSKVEYTVNGVGKHVNVRNVFICIGGEKNFRKDFPAKWVKYKDGRSSVRPTVFDDLRRWIKDSYKSKCIVSDNEETDDVVVRAGFAGGVVACQDKDIPANCVGWLYNYDKDLFWYNSDKDRWCNFCTQMLVGDSIDKIPGVEKLSDEVKQKYGITNNGVGDATAEKLLSGCATEKEAWERVIEAYSSSPVSTEEWKERMQENAFFLWMCREKGQHFVLKDYLKGLGIDY